jgi:ABC-type polar amino acid transport system ATPase subunit
LIVVQKRPKEEAEPALELLQQVGLADKRDQCSFQLSGGPTAARRYRASLR